MKFSVRSINVRLWFYHLETLGQNLIFCSEFCLLLLYVLLPSTKSNKSFLGMEYILKYLHKLLKWSEDGKHKGERSQTGLIEEKHYDFLGHALGYHRTLVSWLAHSRKYRETFNDVDSCGGNFMALLWFSFSISALSISVNHSTTLNL